MLGCDCIAFRWLAIGEKVHIRTSIVSHDLHQSDVLAFHVPRQLGVRHSGDQLSTVDETIICFVQGASNIVHDIHWGGDGFGQLAGGDLIAINVRGSAERLEIGGTAFRCVRDDAFESKEFEALDCFAKVLASSMKTHHKDAHQIDPRTCSHR